MSVLREGCQHLFAGASDPGCGGCMVRVLPGAGYHRCKGGAGVMTVQETFPYLEDATEILPYHIYDMNLVQFTKSYQKVNTKQEKTTKVRVPPAYFHTGHQISKDLGMSKTQLFADSLKHGLSIWEHVTHEDYNTTLDAREALFHADYDEYERVMELDSIFPKREKGDGKSELNIVASNATRGAISDQAYYLNTSGAEFGTILLGISFMRWPKLPEPVRDIILSDLCKAAERQDDIVKACKRISQYQKI